MCYSKSGSIITYSDSCNLININCIYKAKYSLKVTGKILTLNEIYIGSKCRCLQKCRIYSAWLLRLRYGHLYCFFHFRILSWISLGFVLCSLDISQLLLSVLEICNEFVPFPLCQCSSSEDIGLKLEMISE